MNEPLGLDVKKSMLRKQVCFSQLTDDEIEILASILVEKHFVKGDVIVKEGERVDSAYLIISGDADVRRPIDKDFPEKTHSIATLGKDTAIGLNETGFYSLTGIRTATVIALTDMVALRLSVAAFHGFALAYSHVNEVMRQHARKILQF